MVDMPTRFSTCPHCGCETPNPDETAYGVFMVAYAVHPCVACKVSHVHPKAFTYDELQSVVLNYSAALTNDSGKDTIPDE